MFTLQKQSVRRRQKIRHAKLLKPVVRKSVREQIKILIRSGQKPYAVLEMDVFAKLTPSAKAYGHQRVLALKSEGGPLTYWAVHSHYLRFLRSGPARQTFKTRTP